ncbi:MAG TPA: hypothetical protein DCP38_03395 [Acidobacteria bacterium]|nr:response regulator [Vicinamibacterales bacterium]HAK54518.1 hypothetical protein [Acidobacteriota bacterium]
MAHRLLLADDSVTIQRVIELTFTEEDVTVTAVGDGQQAIDQIRAEPPDIVLADVGMPEKTGYEVAEFVKGDPLLSRIPVILLTGAYEPVDEERAKRIGCDGHMVKPFEPQMVINRVRDLLAGERPAALWTAPLDDEVSGIGAKAIALVREVDGATAEPAPVAAEPDPAPSAIETPSVDPTPSEATPVLDELQTETSNISVTGESVPPEDSLDDYFDHLEQLIGQFGESTKPGAADAPASDLVLNPPDLEASEPAADASTAVPTFAPTESDSGASTPAADLSVQPAAPDVPDVQPFDDEPAASAAPDDATPPPEPEVSDAVAPGEADPVVEEPAAVAPAEVEPAVEEPPAAPTPMPPVAAPPAAAGAPVSLAEAFAALLAAEQSWPSPQPTAGERAASALATERLVAAVTSRVLDQLTDQVVEDAVTREVSQVAERLVQDEIDRIKSDADAT